MLELKIRTGGAAFHSDDGELDEMCEAQECARLLKKVAFLLNEGEREGSILDINGNKVGEWRLD